ncbi:MAG: RNA polymerase sigma factor [Planctomycetaceae bacterium]
MVEQNLAESPPVPSGTKAFEILVRRHHRRLLAYAVSILSDENTARDVVQDSFVVAHRRLEDFDTTKDFAAWMRGIVRNRCRESRRAEGRLLLVESATLEAIEQQHKKWDFEEAEQEGCALRALQGCIGKLPEMLHQAVSLFYLQKLSGAEVADRVGIGEATIRKRLQRARQNLADCITRTLEASV